MSSLTYIRFHLMKEFRFPFKGRLREIILKDWGKQLLILRHGELKYYFLFAVILTYYLNVSDRRRVKINSSFMAFKLLYSRLRVT